MKEQIILTNDPSMTAWGYAVMDAEGRVLEANCIKTEPKTKKRQLRAGDDLVRRIWEINEELLTVINTYRVTLILSELPHGSQSATAAKMLGVVTGQLQTISDARRIPIEWYYERDAKQALFRRDSATKQQTVQAIGNIYKVPWTGIKYKDEAIADAIAIYFVASRTSSILKLIQNTMK